MLSIDAVNVLLRIFKKSLFGRVQTPFELFRNYNWGENEWKEFFFVVLDRSYDTPTEQWNMEIRRELQINLKQEVGRFKEQKKLHKIANKELTHPTHEYSLDRHIVSKVRNLKWNFEEFNVTYKSEKENIRVWKYYLKKLLKEDEDTSMVKPSLTVDINKNQLVEFWDELKLKFMPSKDELERQYILKVMILIYQKHFETLRELRTLPYWLKLLEFPDLKSCHFLLLQFILASLSVKGRDDSIANNNY